MTNHNSDRMDAQEYAMSGLDTLHQQEAADAAERQDLDASPATRPGGHRCELSPCSEENTPGEGEAARPEALDGAGGATRT